MSVKQKRKNIPRAQTTRSKASPSCLISALPRNTYLNFSFSKQQLLGVSSRCVPRWVQMFSLASTESFWRDIDCFPHSWLEGRKPTNILAPIPQITKRLSSAQKTKQKQKDRQHLSPMYPLPSKKRYLKYHFSLNPEIRKKLRSSQRTFTSRSFLPNILHNYTHRDRLIL